MTVLVTVMLRFGEMVLDRNFIVRVASNWKDALEVC